MQEKSVLTGHLSELKQKIENGLEELKSSKELYEFKSEYLEGKKSKISGLMKEMKNIAPEERANYGKSVNELKEWALGRFQKVEEEMKERELQKKYESPPHKGTRSEISRYHPDFCRYFLQTLITGAVTYTKRLSLLAFPVSCYAFRTSAPMRNLKYS